MDLPIDEYIGNEQEEDDGDDNDDDGDEYVDDTDTEADSEMEGEEEMIGSEQFHDEGDDVDVQPLEDEIKAFDNYDDIFLAEPPINAEEAMDEQICDNPDEDDNAIKLLTPEEEALDSLTDVEPQGLVAHAVGQETADDQGYYAINLKSQKDSGMTFSKECDTNTGDSHSWPEKTPHVKTSAVMRVGLLELLELIDDKLKINTSVAKAREA